MYVYCIRLYCLVLYVSKKGMGLEHRQHQQRLEFLLVLVPLPETTITNRTIEKNSFRHDFRGFVLVVHVSGDTYFHNRGGGHFFT